jgi:hypothetical protein
LNLLERRIGGLRRSGPRVGVYNRPMFGVRLATVTGKQYSFFVRD